MVGMNEEKTKPWETILLDFLKRFGLGSKSCMDIVDVSMVDTALFGIRKQWHQYSSPPIAPDGMLPSLNGFSAFVSILVLLWQRRQ